MEVLESRLDGPLLLRPAVHADDRGLFQETWRRAAWSEAGVREEFVQDNHSRSMRGVVRGMHLQVGAGQAKLVRCARGSVLDVLVDVRRGSPTFGQWESYELDEDGLAQLYCPVGFAHGFCVTSEVADVLYRCSAYHEPELERTIAWDDPKIGIEWPAEAGVVSDRDAHAPTLEEVAVELPFEYERRRR